MKFSLLTFAIGAAANTTPTPVCWGLDPYRATVGHEVRLANAASVETCMKQGLAHGHGIEVVSWDVANNDCFGFTSYSGSCDLKVGW
jgi:hypothetical protein